MKIDNTKANAAIDDYIAELRAPNAFPRQISSLYHVKILLEKHGVIESWCKLDWLDHCVLFMACIVACKRVREVSRVEREQHAVNQGKSWDYYGPWPPWVKPPTLEGTLRKWRSRPRHFHMLVERLDKHLADTLGGRNGPEF
jgi:hypothetical protein